MPDLPDWVERTGVFASEEEQVEIMRAYNAPLIWLGGPPLNPQVLVHQTALKHGLPEITGFYGLTPEREFIRARE